MFNLSIIIISLLLSSCAKFSYVTEQAVGQLSLEYNGVDNEKILMDPKLTEVHKEKIKKIEDYKKYFYKYFDRKETSIYSETTILEQEAVTYLVIVSPKTKIEALKTSFPFVGEFPYLGFFKKESAINYKKKMEKEDFVTYMRPVYAYSTLNKLPFYDNILSSFFYYSDQRLAELIFHELTHTIFFAKDEVEFNESFAEYIGKKLSYEYFKYSKDELKKWVELVNQESLMMEFIAGKAKELNQLYLSETNISFESANIVLEKFLGRNFSNETKSFCKKNNISKCWPLDLKWNNAMFAAFVTYTQEQNLIEKIQEKKQLSLKSLIEHIEKRYKDYKKTNEGSFVKFLKEKEQV